MRCTFLECERNCCGECKASADEAYDLHCDERLEYLAELEEEAEDEEENMDGLDPAFRSWTDVNAMFYSV